LVTRLYDSSTGNEIICFYNPRTYIRYCFLFGYVEGRFRIIRFLRYFSICVTATFSSETMKRHWSKNLYVENMLCRRITFPEYAVFVEDSDFENYLREVESEVIKNLPKCFNLFGVPFEIAGIEYRTINDSSYCCAFRRQIEEKDEMLSFETKKCRCYEYELPRTYTELIALPKCEMVK